MKVRPGNYWNFCGRQAFTLVEVVASLMLLGTLLVSILMAHRGHVQQIRNASIRLKAIETAERILAQWSEEGTWGMAEASGGLEGFTWRWTVLPSVELRCLGAAIGRFEVFLADREERAPLVQVEVLTTDTAAGPHTRN